MAAKTWQGISAKALFGCCLSLLIQDTIVGLHFIKSSSKDKNSLTIVSKFNNDPPDRLSKGEYVVLRHPMDEKKVKVTLSRSHDIINQSLIPFLPS